MNKKWQYYKTDINKINSLQNKYNLNKIVATVICNRDIDVEDVGIFLNPTRNDFHNPFLMPDMEKAIDRIIKAIEKKEKIIIYGDYDVDGITSTTVLKSFFKDRNIDVDYYIPNRLSEGYGLNKDAIKKIADKNYNLIITVDCGISGIEEVDYANSLGLDVIITDHHEPSENLPNAIAVVDAKRKDNKYPFRELAGVGVVFKVIQALSIKLNLEEKEYLKYLDIVAIGTISDIVPLVNENRVITKLGLKLVACTKNIGLKSILQSSGYSNIDSTVISFGVAPRINACGRMGVADDALNLLLSNDKTEVQELTNKLNAYNYERQKIEKSIFDDVQNQIKEKNLEKENSIIVGGDNWHHGVIGIVASKITDLYFKPSILICYEDEGNLGKGSGRSIPGFDLYKALTECSSSLGKFGGHAMAVGVSVERDNFPEFKLKLQEIIDKNDINNIQPIINIDMQIDFNDITKEMVESLKLLEPFGEANKMPIFAFKNLKIDSIRTLSEGKHLKLTLKTNNGKNIINAIGFNIEEKSEYFKIGDMIDIAGNLEINSFNGVDSVQINIKDVMKSV